MYSIKEGLTFDDVLLVPKHSKIKSRSEIDLSVKINDFTFNHPIVPANMKTIIGEKMALEIYLNKGMGLMHRFLPIDVQIKSIVDIVKSLGKYDVFDYIGFSIGVQKEDLKNVNKIVDAGGSIICIDIAHGDSKQCIKMIEWIKKAYPKTLLIAGNVATGSGAKNLWTAGADIVKVGVGGGCFAAGTRVLMSNGIYKNIEDIKTGDRIINKNGQPKMVLKSFSTGIKNVSKIRNSIFYKDTYVTPDHNYFIGDLSSVSKKTLTSHGYAKILSSKSKTIPKQNKLKWQKIGKHNNVALLMPRNISFEIPKTFKECIFIRNGGNRHSSIKKKCDFILEPTYDVGYMFGTFLGDGHSMITNNGSTNIGSVHWYFGFSENHVANKLSICVKNLTGRELKIKKKKNIIVCSLYHKPLAEFLFTFGKKQNKHLPAHLIVQNKEYLQGILDGLIDSDGNIEKNNRISFTNTSVELIELFNVVTYLVSGVFPNNQKCNVSAGNLKKANIKNFNIPYLARINTTAKKRLIKEYQISKLLEYSETKNNIEVFDLTIDCDTHSFIADNAIVHNSLCTTRVETGNGVPQLTALMDVYDWHEEMEEELDRKLYIISDGGLKSAGDIVKALCFSHMIMAGNAFAGCNETPGNIIHIGDKMYKEYVGSSTHKTNYIEGVSAIVKAKGSFNDILQKMLEGIRSGCSYQDASNLTVLRDSPRFVKITNSGLIESKPHDIIMV